jgi:hypothetical protein
VAWSGACSNAAGTIELAAGLAAALQLPAGVEVSIELLPTIAAGDACNIKCSCDAIKQGCTLITSHDMSNISYSVSNMMQNSVVLH